MLETKYVFIFGYSGHAYVIIESLLDAGYEVRGYFDHQKSAKNPYNLEYFGSENTVDVKNIVQRNLVFPTVGDNSIREKLVLFFDSLKLNQFVAIDPTAQISKTADVDLSSYIGKNVSINAQSKIGKGVILNTNCVIEHECIIEDYVHVAPSSVLCGNVSVRKNSFIGANSTVKQNIVLIDNVIIGAGSLVVKDINVKGTWMGNPAKLK
ncbi:MAG: UDP-N-acetylbacillosamine N-acetyltransferase [Parvicella sp.]